MARLQSERDSCFSPQVTPVVQRASSQVLDKLQLRSADACSDKAQSHREQAAFHQTPLQEAFRMKQKIAQCWFQPLGTAGTSSGIFCDVVQGFAPYFRPTKAPIVSRCQVAASCLWTFRDVSSSAQRTFETWVQRTLSPGAGIRMSPDGTSTWSWIPKI